MNKHALPPESRRRQHGGMACSFGCPRAGSSASAPLMASGIDNTSGGLPAAYPAAPAERPDHSRANGVLTALEALDRPTILIGSVALTCFSAIALLCVAGFAAGLVGLLGHMPGTRDAILAIADGLVPSEPADALARATGYLTEHGGLAFLLCAVALIATAGAGAAYARVF